MKLTNTTRTRGRDRVKGQHNKRVTKAEVVDIAFRIAKAYYKDESRTPVTFAFDGYVLDKELNQEQCGEVWKDFFNVGRLCGVSVLRRDKDTYYENGLKMQPVYKAE